MRLLSAGSVKIEKSNKFSWEFYTKILYLSPYKVSGYNTCAHASPLCAKVCLDTAGMGIFSNVQEARINKTKFFFENRPDFLRQLSWELHCEEKLAAKKSMKLAARLNGTSDLPWEKMCNIIQDFGQVQFYDYTKSFGRMMAFLRGEMPPNYHLTFSLSEVNLDKSIEVLQAGGNIAAVFVSDEKKADRKFPAQWLGYKVIDGDQHDLRFLDPKNVVVGLWAKGKARKNAGDFAIYA
jgi:hypothetical protein